MAAPYLKSVSKSLLAGGLSFFGILSFVSVRVAAQNQPVKFEHLSVEHGLSSTGITCILQDNKGFLWFGTDLGLNKYDGYSFTVYKHNPDDPNSLSDNSITSLFEDRFGTLWIGTANGGLNKFDRKNENFTHYRHDPQTPKSLSHNFVFSLYEDKLGVLWIGTIGGLNKFIPNDSDSIPVFTHYKHDPNNPRSLSSNFVNAIYEDHLRVLWVGTYEGLNIFDREREQFIHYRHDPQNLYSLSNNNVRRIYEDRSGMLWIGTWGGGLNAFDRKKEHFTHYKYDPNNPHSLSGDIIWSISEDYSGRLWVGTYGGGLDEFDRDKGQFIHYSENPDNPNGLSTSYIHTIYEERSGSLWIGTGNGLHKLDREKQKFMHYARVPNNPNSLSHNIVYSICEDRAGMLWIGTGDGGLNKFDRGSGKFTHYFSDRNNPNSLSHNSVHSILEDRQGALWIATVNGLNKFDIETEKFTHYLHDSKNPNSLSHSWLFSICEGASGVLWVGTADGLNKFDYQLSRKEAEKFRHFKINPLKTLPFDENLVYYVYKDLSGDLWLGTWIGLVHFDRETEAFTLYPIDPHNPGNFGRNQVLTINEDQSGMLWVGTPSGLSKFDKTQKVFTHYRKKDGLLADAVFGILADDWENLWLASNNGLLKFNPRSGTFRRYDKSDGLQENEFATAHHKSARTSEMFFGGINGFNVFHPDSLKDNPYIPPVVITHFERYNIDNAENKPIVEKAISEKQHLVLSYKDNILTFEFAALSYLNNTKNQYAYKLEGFNDNWIQLGTKRDVTFTNLDPGEYTLRVKGSNNDGIWNEEGASLKITITPPWWKTWWAYTLYVLCAASLLYGLRRYEMNRLRLKNQLEIEHVEAVKMKELDHLKSRFFANISHEFRTPLTLILGPVEQMRGNAFKGNMHEAYDMILRNGRRLLRLINQLLDLARLEAGSMSLQTQPENIVPFLKGLVLSFASAAERKGIALSIAATEENLIVYFDRDKLEKIVSNLLSNALKFTPEGGKISVQLSVTSDQLRRKPLNTDHGSLNTGNWLLITVSDTGPGIPAELCDKIFDRFYQVDASHTRAHEGTGIGLALTKELVELHGGEIQVESEVGRGARFVVRLPLRVADSDQFEARSMEQGARLEDRESRIEDREVRGQQQASSDQQRATSNQILIIEDHAEVRTFMRQYLEPEFRVLEAVDGEDGVALALETIPDLIICDVMMPKRDGYEVCRMLKTEEKTSHVPIIMLTAKADRESKVHGLETGADDYLLKPFDARELLARVHNLIKLRQQLRARFGREITLQPKDIALTSMDEQFLTRAMQIVEEHMSESELGVEFLAHKIGMSRVHLNRKLRGLTDQTANEFIRTLRLKRAAQMLQKKSATVLEIAYEVGFSNPSYFAECFEKQFGVLPSKFAE